MRLLYHQVTALQAVLVSKGDEFLHDILFLKISLESLTRLEIIHLLTVLVGIVEGILQDKPRHRSLLIIRCHAESILRHKDVRSNTSTSVDYTSVTSVILRTRMLDAILREELPMLISADKILLVVLVGTRGIWLLYATARRTVITCYRKTDHRMVGELYRLLYQTLSERTAPDNRASVVILDGSCKNLGC